MIARELYGSSQDAPSSEMVYALCARSISEGGRRSTDKQSAAHAMAMAGVDCIRQDRFAEARAYLSLSIELYQAAGSQWGVDRATGALAELEFAAGRPEVALDLGRTLTLRNPDPGFLSNFAAYLYACDHVLEAHEAARASVAGARISSRPFVCLIAMQTFAATNARLDPVASAHLFGYVTSHLLNSEYYYYDYTERYIRDVVKAALIDMLGEERYQAELAGGRRLYEDDAYAIVLRDEAIGRRTAVVPIGDRSRSRVSADPLVPEPFVGSEPSDDARQSAGALSALSEREWMIAKRVARGMSNAAIADELSLSRRTVETHVATILRKLNLRNRVLLASLVSRFSTR